MVMIKAELPEGGICVFDTADVLLASSNRGGRYIPSGGTSIRLKHCDIDFVITMEPEAYAAIACAGFEHIEAAAKLVS